LTFVARYWHDFTAILLTYEFTQSRYPAAP
jgi:hypothetical protein